MITRNLGRTGYNVSQLGFGAMRLPMTGEGPDALVDRDKAIPVIHRAFELGITYIDTARGYCNEDSQRAVGEALKSWPDRDNIVVSTKNPYFGMDESIWWTNLENSLKRLRVDALDIYHYHGITWKIFADDIEPRVSRWMRSAYDQGLVKHICFSFHDTCDALIRLIDTGHFESVTLQYNMLDRSLEDGIAHAAETGLGVVVMGPVGGGRLAEPSGVLADVTPQGYTIPHTALRFVLSNPHVTVALSGMSTMKQVVENCTVAGDEIALTTEEKEHMSSHLDRLGNMADLYCTGCGYCMPCPEGVNIPRIFQLYNHARVYDIWDSSRTSYANLGEVEWEQGKKADRCIQCGKCEEACPQNIAIRSQLKDAHDILTRT